ncbi:MAG: hypothetical protein GKC10_08695 [Methanosarcinales archaeon]|nr:hypothetical protein [Methanosarcinales archaeon]
MSRITIILIVAAMFLAYAGPAGSQEAQVLRPLPLKVPGEMLSLAPPAEGQEDALKELPVYRLKHPDTTAQELSRLAEGAFGIREGRTEQSEDRSVVAGQGGTLEVYRSSSGLWFQDQSQLWNPEAKPTLIGEEEARKAADSLLQDFGLLPRGEVLEVSYLGVAGTQLSILNAGSGQREDRQLDVQISYGLSVRGDGFTLPVTGGGAKYNVVFGDRGRIIGYIGPRLEVERVEGTYPLLSREEADHRFVVMTSNVKLESYEATLAYYLAPNGEAQDYLAPVYVYSGMLSTDQGPVPMRNVIIPATGFTDFIDLGGRVRMAERSPEMVRQAEVGDPDEAATEVAIQRTLQTGPLQPLQPLQGAALQNIPLRTMASSIYEAGTSWIGPLGGLEGSPANAQGFVDEMAADGWSIDFNWGDANAWESDWNANDDDWVDDEDIVFYTGHAGVDGWTLSPPNDDSLHRAECSPAHSPADMWGSKDLEWVIIAACGPLEDDILSPGGGDVFRWNTAFDGLHQLLGYGAVTYDNTAEGRTVARYMKQGKTIIDSWFRTAVEIQPSTNTYSAPYGPRVWVGVMYVYKSGTTSPYNDHLWTHGSVAPDPTNPDTYIAMWSPT